MSSRKDPWFKWVINRWFAGTRKLSFAAKGLYADLITLWRDGQTIPNDLRAIADMTGERDYRSVRKPLEELMKRGKVKVDADGNLYNPSVDDDIEERAGQLVRKRSGGGEGGGGAQRHLPFRPHVVGKSVGNDVESGSGAREIASSPPSDRDQFAIRSQSRSCNPLICRETGATSEKRESRDQNVVAANCTEAARARGDPAAARA